MAKLGPEHTSLFAGSRAKRAGREPGAGLETPNRLSAVEFVATGRQRVKFFLRSARKEARCPGQARLVPPCPLEKRFPPGAIVRVPVDGEIEAVLEIVERLPLQLALGERRIDGIAAIVAEAIGDVGDQ